MNISGITGIAVLALAASVASAGAQHGHHQHGPSGQQISKYAGQQTRAIKSLSPADIAELRRGGGWGLARAAELNGIPGPAHILEMKERIHLTPDQTARVQALFETMRAAAIPAGEKLIALEQKLEKEFRAGTVTEDSLRKSLSAIAGARAKLRFIHLSAHLKTPAILSAEQIRRYNILRGYAKDPCTHVPEGHDAAMWKKHNGCK